MAMVAGAEFAAALLLSPSHGLLAKALTHERLARRLDAQLLLLHLDKQGRGLPLATLEHRFGWSRRRLERVLARMRAAGWVEVEGEGLRLTPDGARALEASGRAQLAHPLTAPSPAR